MSWRLSRVGGSSVLMSFVTAVTSGQGVLVFVWVCRVSAVNFK